MMQQTKRKIKITLTIIGLIFLLIGLFYQIPEREIPWNYEEYVGGDAYNMMIEASIRGGEIAGATTQKAIYIVFGTTLLLIAEILNIADKAERQKLEILAQQNQSTNSNNSLNN